MPSPPDAAALSLSNFRGVFRGVPTRGGSFMERLGVAACRAGDGAAIFDRLLCGEAMFGVGGMVVVLQELCLAMIHSQGDEDR